MARTPDDFDPDELDARWDDLTSRLGPLRPPQEPLPGERVSPVPPTPLPGPRDYDVEDDEGGFEQPDPQLGNPDPVTALAWFALGVGIVGAFAAVVAGAAGWVGVLSSAAAVGGLVTLLVRLPQHSERDDDGAQV